MKDLISRQAALDAIMGQPPEPHYPSWHTAQIEKLPAVQPDHNADSGKKVSIPCAHENDVIFRKAAIDAVEKSMYENPHENEIHRGMHDHEHRHFLTILMGLPSAQPERKKGKWIYGEDEYGIDGYHCDKCGFFVPWDYAHTFINYIEDYNFCPNCGADMRGEQDG